MMKPMKVRQNVQRWLAPLAGWNKYNTDGAFYLDKERGASGAALRNMVQAFLLVGR
jgi:hypothetical protein